MRRNVFLFAALTMAASRGFAIDPGSSPCLDPDEFNRRVQAFRGSEAGDRLDAGFALSECVIVNGDLFFRVMLVQRDVFNDWLNGLSVSTFTIDDSATKPRIVKMKKQMSKVAKQCAANPGYGSIAKELAKELARIRIREID